MAASFVGAYPAGETIAILLEPTPGDGDAPIALRALSPAGEFVVRVNVRGTYWAQLIYQFAHEFCHVVANPGTFARDRFSWIEEALCETGSLFALRRVSKAWAEVPPYPNWREYASAIAAYEDELAEGRRSKLLPGEHFASWLAQRIPLLEADSARRDDNAVIAKKLLPIVEGEGTAWESLRSLHRRPHRSAISHREFLEDWAAAAPERCHATVHAIAAVLAP